MNVLNNVFKTAGVGKEQPWKKYYTGIKPVNPLGGDVVRRMGNKVKGVVSSTVGGNKMKFGYGKSIHTFSTSQDNSLAIITFGTQPIGYIPPYKPLQGSPAPLNNSEIVPIASNLIPPGMSPEDYKMYQKQKRDNERTNRENNRDARRTISDARASYRTLLDTGRESRNWLKFVNT